ncbi:MAG: DUF4136 domain-containing protein [Halioglobus sp.]
MDRNLAKIQYGVYTAAFLLLLSACVSAPPKPDVDFSPEYNFSGVAKVGFYEGSGVVSGDHPNQVSDMQRGRVDKSLRLAIESKGLTFVEDPAQADLLLSWHLSTQDKTDVNTYEVAVPGVGVGYRGYYGRYNRYSYYDCWSCMQTQTEVSVRNYVEGTFIVDMIDPKVKKSVWRSVVHSKLKGKLENDQNKYNAAGQLILADFPPQ